MIEQKYSDIVTDELMQGAYLHDSYIGFLEDYGVLNCLLRIHKPKSVFEIGTNIAEGVNVIKTALPEAEVYSLDLPYEDMRLNSKQYPIGIGGEDRVGSATKLPYTQLRGDSQTFDYSAYPCEAYWCDAEHITPNVKHETIEMLKQRPKLIVYHDCDSADVWAGIITGISDILPIAIGYKLYRVVDTRIGYLLRDEAVITSSPDAIPLTEAKKKIKTRKL